MTKSYDPNEDYKKKMDEAVLAGDYASAAQYEQQRNAKIQGEGLTQYQTTNQYASYLPKSNRQQMEDVMQRILNREDFTYDMNADALYQQYKDKFTKQGRLAMEDTMGQAAALTGGYGNSYAQTVGQQAYYDRLGQLDGIVPELYSMAKQKYDDEGDALWNRYNLLADREADEYSRELAQQEYDAAKQAEERDRAYSLALQMLQSGVMPSEGLLTGSGISAEDAQKIYGAYAPQSYSGGNGGGDADKSDTPAVGTYQNGMTMDAVVEDVYAILSEYPEAADPDHPVVLTILKSKGYTEDAMEYFKKVWLALRPNWIRSLGG